MGTRRLKLYLSAYLRGLLKYPEERGLQSQLRERVMLDCLMAENDAKRLRDHLDNQRSVTSKIKPSHILKHLRELETLSNKLRAAEEYDMSYTDENTINEGEALARVYAALEAAGVVGRVWHADTDTETDEENELREPAEVG